MHDSSSTRSDAPSSQSSSPSPAPSPFTRPVIALIAVSALGYFVDAFDILLFSVVRTASLRDLGVPDHELLDVGVRLLNLQMLGMLIGGVAWGVYGDKRGRLTVLFGSILVYSAANILNGFVTSVDHYAALRFIAGFGLAGELGAGITLVAEALPKEKRGIGTTIIATTGVAGSFAASIVGQIWEWRDAYFIAGGMGLALLVLRISVNESKLFKKSTEASSIQRGSIIMLFNDRSRLVRFLLCIAVGMPIYFVLGILVTFAPEIGEAKGLGKALTSANAVFYCYIGFISGDLGSGLLSQLLRSRRKVLFLCITLTVLISFVLLLTPSPSLSLVHALYVAIGLFAGYWVVVATVAAEQFGTNLRATVATSVPNFIRATVIPLTILIQLLLPSLGLAMACAITLGISAVAALGAAFALKETFATDLDYYEE
jgi:putative MFS transporter